MSDDNAIVGCLGGLFCGWLALWLLANAVELVHKVPGAGNVIDGIRFTVGLIVYFVVALLSSIGELIAWCF